MAQRTNALVNYLMPLMTQPFKEIIVFLSSIWANMADLQYKRQKYSVFTIDDCVGNKAERNNMSAGL